MLIYSSEQLKTKVENIISKTKMEETPIDSPPSVEESSSPVVEERSHIMEKTPIDTSSTSVNKKSKKNKNKKNKKK